MKWIFQLILGLILICYCFGLWTKKSLFACRLILLAKVLQILLHEYYTNEENYNVELL